MNQIFIICCKMINKYVDMHSDLNIKNTVKKLVIYFIERSQYFICHCKILLKVKKSKKFNEESILSKN